MRGAPSRTRTRPALWGLALWGLALLACAEEPESAPAPIAIPSGSNAKPEIVAMLRAADDAPHHAADAGGRAWLERDEDQLPYSVVSTPDRFRIVYEVGPLGIATGGGIYLQVSPFWDWSTPQTEVSDALGYTQILVDDPSIEFRAATLDQQLLGIEVTGRALVAGERLEILYGAGPAGAMTDRYAERDSPFWVAVDGDGDGVRRVLVDSPTIDVRPGPARTLLFQVPSVARPGDAVRLTLAFVDARRNTAIDFEGEVRFPDAPTGIELPEVLRFEAADRGTRSIEVRVHEPGTYRLVAQSGDLRVDANPLLVSAEGPRILWGDLHGHTNLSDGTGVPEDYFRYARDVSGLEVVALTDHDHWGMLPLAQHEDLWEEIETQTRRFHEPGRFVTLLGYEWTSWIYGHRHVLYFEDQGRVYDSVEERYETPQSLWKALADAGKPALTFAHHSGGGPIATDWEVPPDPRFEPLVEIVSIHGSSEAYGAPGAIYDPVPGHFVRDALDRGYRLGFLGSGDRHDGHPGAYQRDPPEGGLAAILAETLSREAVLEALRERRVYATNGARILLRTALAGHPMGSEIPVNETGTLSGSLYLSVIAPAPLESLELVRSGRVVDGVDLEGRMEVTLMRELEGLEAGEYLYVRVLQRDGGAAWSSPFFVME